MTLLEVQAFNYFRRPCHSLGGYNGIWLTHHKGTLAWVKVDRSYTEASISKESILANDWIGVNALPPMHPPQELKPKVIPLRKRQCQ